MGSLMSGWDAQVQDPKNVKLMRNKSLTKDEIEAYWRSKKKTEEDHKKAISSTSPQIHTNSPQKSLTINPNHPMIKNQDFDKSMDDKLTKINNCWWTRSSWAFLNEPPVTGEGSQHKYATQHHVASAFASTEPDTRIIT